MTIIFMMKKKTGQIVFAEPRHKNFLTIFNAFPSILKQKQLNVFSVEPLVRVIFALVIFKRKIDFCYLYIYFFFEKIIGPTE